MGFMGKLPDGVEVEWRLLRVVALVTMGGFVHKNSQKQSAKIDKAIALQAQQIDKLKEYKATLINSAVTGKIKVVPKSDTRKEAV